MSLMLKKYPLNYDWKKGSDRARFEAENTKVLKDRASWSFGKKVKWFSSLVLPQFAIVLALYGSIAYIIVR